MRAFRLGAAQAASACRGLARERRQRLQRAQVQHLVADRHAAAERLAAAGAAEDGERQVLDREVRAGRVGRCHPAAQRGVVRGVEARHAARRSVSARGGGASGVRLPGGEVLRQALPALRVVLLQLRALQRVARRADHGARLEHERHGVGDAHRPGGIGAARLVEGRGIRAVAAHAVVQRGAARLEALRLGVVDAVDEAHELAGDVAVEPGRAERVLHRQPARREDDEVDVVDAGRIARRLQHQEDGRVRDGRS